MQQPSLHGTPQEWQQQQQQHNNGLQQPSDSSPAAALRRQQPTDDADPEPPDTAVLIDSSSETQSQAAARQQYTKQVSFPPDDTLATVHQLHPSSSAGDLAPWGEEAAAVADPQQQPAGAWARFKAAVKRLKHDVLALSYAVHDPRTPLLSKLLPWLVLAYALSPLDLIPDFIPILGFVDDMLLLPLGLWLSYRLIPKEVMEDSRIRAATEPLLLHTNWVVATLVFVLWCSGLLLLESWLLSKFGPPQLQQWQLAVLGGSAGVLGVAFGVWALLRMRHERQRRAALEEAGGADALLFGHALSSAEEEEEEEEV